MAELKTQKNKASIKDFIHNLSDEQAQKDCRTLVTMMQEATGDKGSMWGASIVGFGSHSYKYASGREGTWFEIGFSPRKQNLTLYLMYGFEKMNDLLPELGKYKTGKACLYVKNLSVIDLEVLKKLLNRTVSTLRNHKHS